MRLIDEILDEFKDINYAYNDCSKFDTLKRMLNDAVEVVRCGKCGLRYKPLDDDARNEIYCEFIGSTMRKDDFCSYGCADGERKEQSDG